LLFWTLPPPLGAAACGWTKAAVGGGVGVEAAEGGGTGAEAAAGGGAGAASSRLVHTFRIIFMDPDNKIDVGMG